MHRTLIVAIVVLAAVGALARPAEASISGASLSTPSTSITNPCAVSVPFSGSISGTPGTTFTYSFNRFVNGVQAIVAGGTVTMPASGSLSVGDTMTFTSSASGKTFDQIWVHNIAGGQPDVYGNIVYVTVSCGAPPPPSSIPAPTNLKQTTDPGVCADHVAPIFGAIICGAALTDNKVVLVWDYGDPNTVDGFRIYQTAPGSSLVAKQSGMTGKALDVKAVFLAGYCYVVRAYKGPAESADSNQFCLSGARNTSLVTVPITAARSTSHFYHDFNNPPYCGLRTGGLAGRDAETGGYTLVVGYTHSYDSGTDPLPCWEVKDWVFRSAVKFDLAPLSGRKIAKATFKMAVENGYLNDRAATVSCASEMMFGVGDWSGAKSLIPGNSYLDMPNGTPHQSANTGSVQISGGRNVTIDVTSAVRQWMLGQPNYGFVFRGSREDDPKSNEECVSTYGNVSLTVEVFN